MVFFATTTWRLGEGRRANQACAVKAGWSQTPSPRVVPGACGGVGRTGGRTGGRREPLLWDSLRLRETSHQLHGVCSLKVSPQWGCCPASGLPCFCLPVPSPAHPAATLSSSKDFVIIPIKQSEIGGCAGFTSSPAMCLDPE